MQFIGTVNDIWIETINLLINILINIVRHFLWSFIKTIVHFEYNKSFR